MWTETAPRIGITPNQLVAAVFLDDTSARDAIADLKLAGFRASEIGVCNSRESRSAPHAADPAGKHSLLWRLRHSVEHDFITDGPGLTSEPAKDAACQEDAAYTELDLASALRSMGLGPDTIQLVDQEIGPDGQLIFVSAGERSREVDSILEKNQGIVRTSMATQLT
jgi:hypothetical protein